MIVLKLISVIAGVVLMLAAPAAAKSRPVTPWQVVRYAQAHLAASPYAGSPLRRDMSGIVLASKRAGVSPFFVLAISGVESGFGQAACGYNAWGWGSCAYDFTSWSDGARVVANSLRANYLNRGLVSVDAVAPVYCPPNSAQWASRVRYLMASVFNADSGLRWSDAVGAVHRQQSDGHA